MQLLHLLVLASSASALVKHPKTNVKAATSRNIWPGFPSNQVINECEGHLNLVNSLGVVKGHSKWGGCITSTCTVTMKPEECGRFTYATISNDYRTLLGQLNRDKYEYVQVVDKHLTCGVKTDDGRNTISTRSTTALVKQTGANLKASELTRTKAKGNKRQFNKAEPGVSLDMEVIKVCEGRLNVVENSNYWHGCITSKCTDIENPKECGRFTRATANYNKHTDKLDFAVLAQWNGSKFEYALVANEDLACGLGCLTQMIV
ncbi:MAG: hypothetical protein M1829_005361 [Trizodia sp. TS-e1964]|nr:MAG: hypothetical protein M1829_005361 [Trizodia sp. TS-e1964]